MARLVTFDEATSVFSIASRNIAAFPHFPPIIFSPTFPLLHNNPSPPQLPPSKYNDANKYDGAKNKYSRDGVLQHQHQHRSKDFQGAHPGVKGKRGPPSSGKNAGNVPPPPPPAPFSSKPNSKGSTTSSHMSQERGHMLSQEKGTRSLLPPPPPPPWSTTSPRDEYDVSDGRVVHPSAGPPRPGAPGPREDHWDATVDGYNSYVFSPHTGHGVPSSTYFFPCTCPDVLL